ncbi:unnamed protein product [Adineta ricciae]|nr:unnamed protein product [Adineta ricciae]
MHLRAFGYYGVINHYLGCNCPGYNYSNSSYDNALSISRNGIYSYTDCNGFGGDEQDDDVIYCCNYCCGLLPIYTTTSVTSTTNSIRTYPISVLFSFTLVLMKMITMDSAALTALFHVNLSA